jgi:hypothetical protein
MRSIRRFAAVAIGLGALALLPVIPAAASSAASIGPAVSNFPPDCTLTVHSYNSESVTCTARPANQTWEFSQECILGHVGAYSTGWGNPVTGDGTSNLGFCEAITGEPIFVIVS